MEMRVSLDSLFGKPVLEMSLSLWERDGAERRGQEMHPHPALRATFSQGEKDTSPYFG